MKILVTGANGQLGSELRELAPAFPQHEFLFLTKEELDISDKPAVKDVFAKNTIEACINAAAYTAVDKAESEKKTAFAINAKGTANLAEASFENNARFIHISTDYVFKGDASEPYSPDHPVDPQNVYGESKLKGEEEVIKLNQYAIIIRTSWVYSFYGNNFVKTMLRLMQSRKELNVVSDQQGCPTYAADLANALLQIVSAEKWSRGIYHYSNQGVTTWFEFAKEINEHCNLGCTVSPITTEQYPTPASRPKYSVMDTSTFTETFGIKIRGWKEALHECLGKLGCK
jgi:dTDP-4-dehydrorhamnose reductase